MLVQVRAKLPSQGGEPFDWNAYDNTKKHYYEVRLFGVCTVIFFERNRSWLYVCNMLQVYYRSIKAIINKGRFKV